MGTAAFWIAIASLVLSVIALTWQIVSWTFTGAKVKVDVGQGFLAYGPDLRDAHFVTARNIGRTGVEITGWGMSLPDGKSLVVPNPEPGLVPPLPGTLEGGHSMRFHLPDDTFLGDLHKRCGGASEVRVRGFVHLGSGKTVRSEPFRLRLS